jgi:hypothetical protein
MMIDSTRMIRIVTRPHVRAADYLALVERSTYGDDRVRIT